MVVSILSIMLALIIIGYVAYRKVSMMINGIMSVVTKKPKCCK